MSRNAGKNISRTNQRNTAKSYECPHPNTQQHQRNTRILPCHLCHIEVISGICFLYRFLVRAPGKRVQCDTTLMQSIILPALPGIRGSLTHRAAGSYPRKKCNLLISHQSRIFRIGAVRIKMRIMQIPGPASHPSMSAAPPTDNPKKHPSDRGVKGVMEKGGLQPRKPRKTPGLSNGAF